MAYESYNLKMDAQINENKGPILATWCNTGFCIEDNSNNIRGIHLQHLLNKDNLK